MRVADEMRMRLEAELSPTALEILDESEQHRGHAGYQEGGQSHFRVRIASKMLGEKSRIERHRAIHNALGKDLVGRIHALAIEIQD